MYGIFTYIWAIFGLNVGKYSIHGAYGMGLMGTNKEFINKNGDIDIDSKWLINCDS